MSYDKLIFNACVLRLSWIIGGITLLLQMTSMFSMSMCLC